MISAARTTRAGGFTLIEIVMVLAIAAVVMGGAVGLMVYSSDERALRDASGKVELMAKRARVIAIREQTPYALEFRPGAIRLLPLAEAGAIEKTTALGRSIGGEPASADAGGVRDEMNLDAQMKMFIRRWNSDAWLPMNANLIHVWRFDPDGICEPLSVRITLGDSWSEDSYHPLTASIRYSELRAR